MPTSTMLRCSECAAPIEEGVRRERYTCSARCRVARSRRHRRESLDAAIALLRDRDSLVCREDILRLLSH